MKTSMKVTVSILIAALLLCAAYALPAPERSNSATDTGSESRSSSSSSGRGSGSTTSGSGDDALLAPCEQELSPADIDRLLNEILNDLDNLKGALEPIHIWSDLRATVGVYGGDHGDTIFSDIDNNGSCIALPSDYGYAIAKSVAFLQMFVRPVGDVLTNETVREVIEQEEGFATNFSAVRDNLASTAEQLYDLVMGYRDIHQCILPSIPLEDDNTVLKPQAPRSVRNACPRDTIVDGLSNELQNLIIHLDFALTCFFELY